MAKGGLDGYAMQGKHLFVMLTRLSAVDTSRELFDTWESVAVQVAAAGTSFEISSFQIWAGLAPERLARVLALRSLSPQNIVDIMNALPENALSWQDLKHGMAFCARGATLLNVQLTMLTIPSSMAAAAAQAILPPSGAFSLTIIHR